MLIMTDTEGHVEVISQARELGQVTEDLVQDLYSKASPEYASQVLRWWYIAQDSVRAGEEASFVIGNGRGMETWEYTEDEY